MYKIIPCLIFVSCAGSAPQYQPPSATPGVSEKTPPSPLASLQDQERGQQTIDEAKLKADMEPKAVKVIRDLFSPNPYDVRYGIPSMARFQRPASPTMGGVTTAP